MHNVLGRLALLARSERGAEWDKRKAKAFRIQSMQRGDQQNGITFEALFAWKSKRKKNYTRRRRWHAVTGPGRSCMCVDCYSRSCVPHTATHHWPFILISILPTKIENNNNICTTRIERRTESATAFTTLRAGIAIDIYLLLFSRFHSHFVTHMANSRKSDEIMAKNSLNVFEPQVNSER